MTKMEKSRNQRITRITLWGAIANLLLTLVKFLAGIFGKSAAMTADAVHSLTDLISDAVVLVMVKISSKGKDKSHDYGHGKFETLATLVVSLLLLVVGVGLMSKGIESIRFVMGGGTIEKPSMIALWAAVISIAVKEILYQWTARVGKAVDSQAVIANAWHHRSDALSSVGSLVGIGGAILLGGKWTVLDPIVGCIISIVIIVVAVKISIPALNELTDASLPDEIESQIMGIIQSVEKVENVHDLRTCRNGQNYIIDAHVVLDPMMTVAEAHDITVKIEAALRQEYGADTLIAIHVEPDEDAD
ncbi:MAG: cation diffusion facilitator family transporter [Bacteroidales bacterium]|nr:cation diffusion facilitator family transporter [Bacteroidales bacterium]